MTVAAVVLVHPEDDPTTPLLGQSRVRRLVDIAWAGGALPTVVVSHDPTGGVAAALAGSAATLTQPAPLDRGPAGHIAGGVRDALAAVESISAALLWPGRRAWLDPETITSLIEAHGADPEAILRPSFQGTSGWPVLLPVLHLSAVDEVPPGRSPDEVIADLGARGIPVRVLELGDPGCTFDATTAAADLPAFHGPEEPVAGPPPEWGSDVTGEGTSTESPLP